MITVVIAAVLLNNICNKQDKYWIYGKLPPYWGYFVFHNILTLALYSSKSSKTSETNTGSAKQNTSKNTAKKKAPGRDLIAFDDAFDTFTELMDSLKTDKYDPSACSMGIISAVRLMNENPEMTFEKALPTTTTEASAKKFLSQISKEDIERGIEAAKEVVKYDPVE